MTLKVLDTKHVALIACLLVAYCALAAEPSLAQRENDDDFEDSGFDDSGYNSPGSHEAEGSNPNPSNYSPSSEEDLDDDDDDTDETNMNARRAEPEVPRARSLRAQSPISPAELQQLRDQQLQLHKQQQQLQQQQAYYANQMLGPQRFYEPDNSVMLASVAPASFGKHRYRRSATAPADIEGDIEDTVRPAPGEQAPLVRRRRHSKYIGPVYTYVKTDKHARFKWGVKHKVGKHYG